MALKAQAVELFVSVAAGALAAFRRSFDVVDVAVRVVLFMSDLAGSPGETEGVTEGSLVTVRAVCTGADSFRFSCSSMYLRLSPVQKQIRSPQRSKYRRCCKK